MVRTKGLEKVSSFQEPKQARIEKAANGYIVSKGYGEKPSIAKTLGEAQKIQAKYLS